MSTSNSSSPSSTVCWCCCCCCCCCCIGFLANDYTLITTFCQFLKHTKRTNIIYIGKLWLYTVARKYSRNYAYMPRWFQKRQYSTSSVFQTINSQQGYVYHKLLSSDSSWPVPPPYYLHDLTSHTLNNITIIQNIHNTVVGGPALWDTWRCWQVLSKCFSWNS